MLFNKSHFIVMTWTPGIVCIKNKTKKTATLQSADRYLLVSSKVTRFRLICFNMGEIVLYVCVTVGLFFSPKKNFLKQND